MEPTRIALVLSQEVEHHKLRTVVAELEHLAVPDTEVGIAGTEVGIVDTEVVIAGTEDLTVALAGMQEDHQLFDLDCKLVERCSNWDNYPDLRQSFIFFS